MIDAKDIASAARGAQTRAEFTEKPQVYNHAQEQRDALQGQREAYRQYQDNIKKAGQLRSDIIKGAAAGEDTQALLLKACECIGAMTGDAAFLGMVKKRLNEARANRERTTGTSTPQNE